MKEKYQEAPGLPKVSLVPRDLVDEAWAAPVG